MQETHSQNSSTMTGQQRVSSSQAHRLTATNYKLSSLL